MAQKSDRNLDITIREYDVLLRGGDINVRGGVAISEVDWDWFRDQSAKIVDGPRFLQPVFRSGRQGLQAQNYVGTVEAPGGTRIEILPKLTDLDTDPKLARRTLLKMLRRVLNLKMSSWQWGHLAISNQPLHEHLISLFLTEIEILVKKGLRSHYVLRQDDQPFLRGRLRIGDQLCRRPGSKPEFAIEYHEFLPDRSENRLIHSAVQIVGRWARSEANQRRARTLRFLLSDIPTSSDINGDLKRWSEDRALVYYQGLKPWCELILKEKSPYILAGSVFGISFLFPMEMLFEKYVAAVLKQRVEAGFRMVAQPSRQYLATHQGSKWFRLKPDLLVEGSGNHCFAILDTKWKRLDESLANASDKYRLSQEDFYQMAIYGNYYLSGTGELFLVFPKSDRFTRCLEPFDLSASLRLWVVPFDLETDELGLPASFQSAGSGMDWYKQKMLTNSSR